MKKDEQLKFAFMFLKFKDHKDKPIFIKPEDIKYIKPAVTNGFVLVLPKDSIVVNHTEKELLAILNKGGIGTYGIR